MEPNRNWDVSFAMRCQSRKYYFYNPEKQMPNHKNMRCGM